MYREQSYVKRKFRAGMEIKRRKMSIMNKEEEIKSISDIWKNLIL